jgi:hypothetical protein
VQRLILPTVAGIGVALLVIVAMLMAGRQFGHEPGIPWSCDDTRYVDTVPTGRAVVGAAVSAPPGCGS